FIYSYFFLLAKSSTVRARNAYNKLFIVLLLCFLGLTKINHVASYVVFFSVFCLFFFYNFKAAKGIAVFAIIAVFLTSIYYSDRISDSDTNPLIEKEIQIYKGEAPTSQLFH